MNYFFSLTVQNNSTLFLYYASTVRMMLCNYFAFILHTSVRYVVVVLTSPLCRWRICSIKDLHETRSLDCQAVVIVRALHRLEMFFQPLESLNHLNSSTAVSEAIYRP